MGVLGAIAVVALASSADTSAAVHDVTLTLASDRSTYYVGEPIRLSLSARNIGTTSVRGFFAALPQHDRAEYRYRRLGAANRRFAPLSESERQPQAPDPRVGRLPSVLGPNEEFRSVAVLVIDPRTRSFVLDEPGEYQFSVTNHPDFTDRTLLQTSNQITVHVEEPPPTHRRAFEVYRAADLGSMVQSTGDYVRDPAKIKAARDFLEQFPQSPYADAVHEACVTVLRERVLYGYATKEEQALLLTMTAMKEYMGVSPEKGVPAPTIRAERQPRHSGAAGSPGSGIDGRQ